MSIITIVLSVFFGFIIINYIINTVVGISFNLHEGLENQSSKPESCNANTQIFKNAGTIANIKDQLNKIQVTIKTIEEDVEDNKNKIKDGQNSIKALGTAQVNALHAQALTEAVEGNTQLNNKVDPPVNTTTRQNVDSSSVNRILGTSTSGMMKQIIGNN